MSASAALRSPFALLRHEAAPGVLLFLSAIVALVLDNSSLAWLYDGLLETPVTFAVGELLIDKPLLLWINDGLMAIFFFYVALEIKRELVEGHLSDPREAALPTVAAIGGMAMPALVFLFFTWGMTVEMQGWAIPAATDIAFALGVLALLGKGVPPALKVFLLSLAIIDDLGAIVIIALFYTADLSEIALLSGALGAAVLVAMNRLGVTRVAPYVLVGAVMWVAVLKSGVHATLAGVIIGLTIPLNSREDEDSPLVRLEHGLKPWVGFFIMPVFAFANAGIPLAGLSFADLLAPLPLGIALGLFVGKQIGVFGFAYLAVRSGLSRLPKGTDFRQIYGVSLLAGIGFTMSLFIGTLAFSDVEHARAVRLGVMSGSILSGLLGFAVLKWATARSAVTTRAAPATA
ncbi:Na+/H+ antiporter NhaA [Nisaea acidiphila]|uniref:Na(+)/H(+) antiporter NhaA n=1 Tax=Nisaea acidiphila TaxID=1862145 RepID=A0A9J7ATC0_9PROT|nr:Na+/H+ antiporter NhaA [Nisaea acidiphila]UUX50584.1 Na+/H+ antiporter NhaA [Nisaea acidiphila]